MSARAKGKKQNSSVRDSVLNISHITYRDCRVHIFSDNSRNSCLYFYLNPGSGFKTLCGTQQPKIDGSTSNRAFKLYMSLCVKVNGQGGEGTPENSF